jgi:hypothetical protein
MARTNVEWVAQVSLLRPGFLLANGPSRNTHSEMSAIPEPLQAGIDTPPMAPFEYIAGELRLRVCAAAAL